MIISNSIDFRRIKKLPRYKWEKKDYSKIITKALKQPLGTQELRQVQGAILAQALFSRGLFAPVGVGHGKTLPSILLATWLGIDNAILMVPAQIQKHTIEVIIPELSKHWCFDPPQVFSYSELSIVDKCEFLNKIKPELIILDECHMLKNRGSARTRRFLRYFAENSKTVLCCMSGTITKDSLMDYWHLITLSLRKGSPLPLSAYECQQWDTVVCPNHEKRYDRIYKPGVLKGFLKKKDKGNIRTCLGRRINQTPGVVATKKSSVGASLVIQKIYPGVPESVTKALKDLRDLWITPSGEELVEAVQVFSHAKELALGFYYEWIWPNNEKDLIWLQNRGAWNKTVRKILQSRYKDIDSPLQVKLATKDGKFDHAVEQVLYHWEKVKDNYKPRTRAVWLSKHYIDYCNKWMEDNIGIVWYEHNSFGKELDRYSKNPNLDVSRSLPLSIKKYGKSFNLQYSWSNNLITSSPSSGLAYEQLLGRTHRQGQKEDQVDAKIFYHVKEVRECFKKALEEAKYLEQTTRQRQKLNFATIL